MGEMREWWTNVYPVAAKDQHAVPYRFYVGQESFTRDEAKRVGERCAQYGVRPVFRLHVRLKPEGAPRRYATITEQDAWEIDPVGSRYYAEQGNSLRYSARSGFYVADYSLLTRNEERT